MHRIAAIALIVMYSLVSGVAPAPAQTYPQRPIRMLMPLAAGSAVDVVARIVAEKMAERLGQGIVVENQPGAAGLIGMRAGAKAEPDGYTIIAVNDSVMTMLPNLRDDAGYDPVRDFAPVAQLVRINWALVAHPSLGVSTLAGLLEKSRAAPDGIAFASGGNGSPQHIAMELLMQAAGVRLRHVSYRGVTPALNDVIAGHVPLMFAGLPMPNEFVRAGTLTLLASAGEQRSVVFPDAPTMAEGGLAGFSFYTWGALLAPAGTPPDIVAQLNAAAVAALADPAVRARLEGLGYSIVANSPAAFAQALTTDIARMRAVIRAARIRADP